MASIGEILRRERIGQGLDLQQLSQTTKIGTRMLLAMEQNDFSKLPGGVFTRSFVKQYAAALGLQPDALDEQLKSLPTGVEEPSRPEPRKDVIPERSHYSLSDYNASTNSGSLLVSLVWVVLAAAVGGAVYYAMNRAPGGPAAAVPKKASPAAVDRPASRTPDAVPQPEATPQPDAAAQSEGTTAAATMPVTVDLNTSAESWVSVTVDGKQQFSGVLPAGERRTLQAQTKVKLVAGNAGAFQITLNGKPVDAIGPLGQVRVVEFTPAGAHVVPRISPNPPPLP